MAELTDEDPLMGLLRLIEKEATSDKLWVHYKGWNDIKTTFRDALAICEELRQKSPLAPHSRTSELPEFSKRYIIEKICLIAGALGLNAKIWVDGKELR